MTVELALIVAAVAIVCLFGLLFVSGGIGRLFDSTSEPLGPSAPLTPPSTAPALVYPTTLEECADPGWQNFPQFPDEAACKAYVEDLDP